MRLWRLTHPNLGSVTVGRDHITEASPAILLTALDTQLQTALHTASSWLGKSYKFLPKYLPEATWERVRNDSCEALWEALLLCQAGRASSVAYIASQNLPQRYGCPGILCYDILGLPDVRLQVVKLKMRSALRLLARLRVGPATGSRTHLQLPFPLSNGQGAVYALMHDILAHFCPFLRPQGKVAYTVLPLVFLQRDVQAVRYGRQEI